ncbi:hypothetical protein ACUN8C_01855 [Kushneria sp. Sum13]|uniref:hypothetical protein n=1 Tax=Kushneria sp. Sum13 TaxID=3459196 RepID=UPI0040463DB6
MSSNDFIKIYTAMTPDQRIKFDELVDEVEEAEDRLEGALSELHAKSPDEIKALEERQEQLLDDYDKEEQQIEEEPYSSFDSETASVERMMDHQSNQQDLEESLQGTPIEAEWIEIDLEKKKEELKKHVTSALERCQR